MRVDDVPYHCCGIVALVRLPWCRSCCCISADRTQGQHILKTKQVQRGPCCCWCRTNARRSWRNSSPSERCCFWYFQSCRWQRRHLLSVIYRLHTHTPPGWANCLLIFFVHLFRTRASSRKNSSWRQFMTPSLNSIPLRFTRTTRAKQTLYAGKTTKLIIHSC